MIISELDRDEDAKLVCAFRQAGQRRSDGEDDIWIKARGNYWFRLGHVTQSGPTQLKAKKKPFVKWLQKRCMLSLSPSFSLSHIHSQRRKTKHAAPVLCAVTTRSSCPRVKPAQDNRADVQRESGFLSGRQLITLKSLPYLSTARCVTQSIFFLFRPHAMYIYMFPRNDIKIPFKRFLTAFLTAPNGEMTTGLNISAATAFTPRLRWPQLPQGQAWSQAGKRTQCLHNGGSSSIHYSSQTLLSISSCKALHYMPGIQRYTPSRSVRSRRNDRQASRQLMK